MSPSSDKRPVLLLVDDSHFSLSQSSRALGDEFEIITASNGAEGLKKLQERSVDLVITDLLMPNISGLAFLGRARQLHPSLKVIVCSADIQKATASKAKSLGATAFVKKPVDPDELRQIVRLVLSNEPATSRINPRYADAFKEIFNIGVGRAADALSELVYDTVKLSVPRLEVIRPSELTDFVKQNFKEDVACVLQPFSGAADGKAYLLMSTGSGLSLVNALLRQESEARALTDADSALLVEVANILINALVGSLANILKIEFQVGHANCEIGEPSSLYEGVMDFDYVLLLETMFVVPGRQIGGTLIILLGSAGMGALFKGIDSVF